VTSSSSSVGRHSKHELGHARLTLSATMQCPAAAQTPHARCRSTQGRRVVVVGRVGVVVMGVVVVAVGMVVIAVVVLAVVVGAVLAVETAVRGSVVCVRLVVFLVVIVVTDTVVIAQGNDGGAALGELLRWPSTCCHSGGSVVGSWVGDGDALAALSTIFAGGCAVLCALPPASRLPIVVVGARRTP